MTVPAILPPWVDRAKYAALGPNDRLCQVQALMAHDGHGSYGAIIGAQRGIPDKPPQWVDLELWNASPDTRAGELARLERSAIRECAAIAGDDLKRGRELKLQQEACVHEFAYTPREIPTRLCTKCGAVMPNV